jgi:hypothetical protein
VTRRVQVSDARARVQAAATAALDAASAAGAGAKAGVRAPSLFFDVANNAVWVRMPGGSAAAATRKLHHPRDRNGKVEGGAYSTAPLDHALDDYRRACAAAEEAVRQQLRDLAESLQPTLANLVTASTFAVVAAALDCHVREAARRGWALPRLEYGPDAALTGDSAQQQQQRSDDPGEGLVIEGMWPYWLDGLDPATVRNSFCMGGMFLLTGPNMAGKSTLLRSTCAVALLGACGLAAPAQRARLPYVDAFMLRNFSADAPLEGRSSFAVEMSEMRFVLEDATRRSLVLVDELGKGTEVSRKCVRLRPCCPRRPPPAPTGAPMRPRLVCMVPRLQRLLIALSSPCPPVTPGARRRGAGGRDAGGARGGGEPRRLRHPPPPHAGPPSAAGLHAEDDDGGGRSG